MKIKHLTDEPQNEVALPGAVGVRMRMLIGPAEGAGVFHMRHFEVAPGGHTTHHEHDYEHEVLILKGTCVLKGVEGERPCRAGDVVWMPPKERHQFVNAGREPLEFICLIPAPQSCTL